MWVKEKTFISITLQVKNTKGSALRVKKRLGKKQEWTKNAISRSFMLNPKFALRRRAL